MIDSAIVSTFPGAELVLPGLRDAEAGRVTIGACLASIARPTIEGSGLVESFSALHYVSDPERTLYALLRREGGDAYGRYNSLLRRLVSFERALRRAAVRSSSAA